MIDVNASVGPWPFRALPACTAAEVAGVLRGAGITRALVSPLEGLFFEDPQIANGRAASSVGAEPMLLLCAVLNPRLTNWRDSLRASQEDLGARAVKLHPNYHLYDLSSHAALDLAAAAGQAGLPVIVQLRVQDTRAQYPLCQVPDVSAAAVLEVARAVPDTQIVLGGIRHHEIIGLAEQIRTLPNVWVELSQAESVDGLRQETRAVGSDRLLLGTHVPLFNVRSSLLKLDEGLLSPEERAAITRGNAERLLRL